MRVYERVSLFRVGSCVVLRLTQQIAGHAHQASGSLPCDRDMVLNRTGVQHCPWWLRRRDKCCPSQGTCGRDDPKAGLLSVEFCAR